MSYILAMPFFITLIAEQLFGILFLTISEKEKQDVYPILLRWLYPGTEKYSGSRNAGFACQTFSHHAWPPDPYERWSASYGHCSRHRTKCQWPKKCLSNAVGLSCQRSETTPVQCPDGNRKGETNVPRRMDKTSLYHSCRLLLRVGTLYIPQRQNHDRQ